MSLASVEREILTGARDRLNNQKLRLKDLLEWCTSEDHIKKGQRPEEVVLYIPDPGVWICVAKSHDKRGPAKAHDKCEPAKAGKRRA